MLYAVNSGALTAYVTTVAHGTLDPADRRPSVARRPSSLAFSSVHRGFVLGAPSLTILQYAVRPHSLVFLGLVEVSGKRESGLSSVSTRLQLTPSRGFQSTRTRSLEGEHVFRKSHYAPLLTLGSIRPSLNARSHIRSRRNGQYSHESSGNTYRGPSVVRAPIQHTRPSRMGQWSC